jgi:hypothetical protein
MLCEGVDSDVYDYIFNWWEKTPETPTLKQVEKILIKVRDGKLWGFNCREDIDLECYLLENKLCASEIEWGFPSLPESEKL